MKYDKCYEKIKCDKCFSFSLNSTIAIAAWRNLAALYRTMFVCWSVCENEFKWNDTIMLKTCDKCNVTNVM